VNHRSLPHLVRSFARLYGPKPVLTALPPSGLAEYTWLDLHDAAWGVAKGLVAAGFPADGTAIVLSADSPEALFAEVAVQVAGGAALAVAPPIGVEDLAAQITATGCSAVLTSEPLAGLAAAAVGVSGRPVAEWQLDPVAPGRPDPGAGDDTPELEARLDRLGPEVAAAIVRAGAPGAGGRHAVLPHRALLGTGAAVARALAAGEADAWLLAGPATHPFVRAAGWWAPLASCGHAVLGGPDPLEAAWATRPRVATCLAVDLPAFVERLLAEVGATRGLQARFARWAVEGAADGERGGLGARIRRALAAAAGPELVRQVVGGAMECVLAGWGPADGTAVRVLAALGVEVRTAWGPPEACGIAALGRPSEPPGGRPLDGTVVSVDEKGEIGIAGPGIMFSYVGTSPEVNPALEGGVLRTGETGRIGVDGSLVVTGRPGDAGPEAEVGAG
jgi:long-subunit acyl-CoA synthetase (AMP-forming)